jgi:hypothetical protein
LSRLCIITFCLLVPASLCIIIISGQVYIITDFHTIETSLPPYTVKAVWYVLPVSDICQSQEIRTSRFNLFIKTICMHRRYHSIIRKRCRYTNLGQCSPLHTLHVEKRRGLNHEPIAYSAIRVGIRPAGQHLHQSIVSLTRTYPSMHLPLRDVTNIDRTIVSAAKWRLKYCDCRLETRGRAENAIISLILYLKSSSLFYIVVIIHDYLLMYLFIF